MLIGSHFVDEVTEEITHYTHLFEDALHRSCTQQIATQLAMLFTHDEIWATCSYEPTDNMA